MGERKIEDGVATLAEEVGRLAGDPRIKGMVEARVAEFAKVKEIDSGAWFAELVYCILTAYSSAELAQLCVDALTARRTMFEASVEEVAEILMRLGHRFAERRAEYIVAARRLAPSLKESIQRFETSAEARSWLVGAVKGIGWKEASHLLRNLGYLDIAILDRHVLSCMREHGLIPDAGPKGLSRRRYLEYEGLLRRVAEALAMPLGQLDLYLWYSKTGKVLK